LEIKDFKNHKYGWRACGNGNETIVFLHGMPGSRAAWDPQLKALGESYRCISWDMPGYGDSPLNNHAADYTAILDSLEEFISETAGDSSVHLVGLSLGGMIALHAAVQRPYMLRSLVVLDTSPCFGFGGDSDPDQFLSDVRAMVSSNDNVGDLSKRLIPSLVAPSCSKQVIDEAQAAMSYATLDGIEFSARLIAIHDVRKDLERISTPLLAMAGAEDNETPPSYAKHIAQSVVRGSCIIVPDSGHLANLENHEFVTAHIQEFFVDSAKVS
jgi:3-oxoadipate enol-lactonase